MRWIIPLLTVTAACTEPDIGSKCTLLFGDKPITPECANDTCVKMQNNLDYVALGAGECEDFTCVASPRVDGNGNPTGTQGYCSRTCAREGEPCEVKGYTCRTLILDQEFLEEVRPNLQARDSDSDGVDDYTEFFGGIAESRFCARDAPK